MRRRRRKAKSGRLKSPAPDWFDSARHDDSLTETVGDPAGLMEELLDLSQETLARYRRLGQAAVSVERKRARGIRRTRKRRKLSAQRHEERRRRSPEVWSKKPKTQELLRPRGLRAPRYDLDPSRARIQAFARIARAEGISVKALRRIASLLTYRLIQELAVTGEVTVPRLGRLKVKKLTARRRSVNLAGRIGENGARGLVDLPAGSRISFRASAALRKVLCKRPNPLPPTNSEHRLLQFEPTSGAGCRRYTDSGVAVG